MANVKKDKYAKLDQYVSHGLRVMSKKPVTNVSDKTMLLCIRMQNLIKIYNVVQEL